MFSGVKSISADKLQKYIKDGSKVTIMDIRPVEEYTHSRIPGSIHYDTAGTQTIFPIVVLVCLNGLHSIERYSAIQKFVLFFFLSFFLSVFSPFVFFLIFFLYLSSFSFFFFFFFYIFFLSSFFFFFFILSHYDKTEFY